MDNSLKALRSDDDWLVVANHIVLFGGRDLYKEYFDESTELDSTYTKTGRLYVDWEHGLDDDPDSPTADDVLGYVDWGTAKKTASGWWVERVLNRRNEYMLYLEELIKAGLIGTSSQAVQGQVERENEGKIRRWPLKRDTMTVNPAEPRMMNDNVLTAVKNLVDKLPALKAYIPQDSGKESGDAAAERHSQITQIRPVPNSGTKDGTDMGDITLTDEQFDALLKREPLPEPEAEQGQMDAKILELSNQIEEVKDFLTKSGKAKDIGYVSPDSEKDHAEQKSFGDFLVSVRNENKTRLNKVYKAALAEGSGPTGGYLVPEEFAGPIEFKAHELSVFEQAGPLVEPMSGRTKEISVLDIETAPSAGNTAFAGGVIAYWTDEAAAITESEPVFRLVELVARKLAAYSLASSEVREDAVASIDGVLAQSFARAIAAAKDYAYFRGDGVGKPLGILTSSALISASRSAASTVALADLAQMLSDFPPQSWTTGAWFFNPAVIDQLLQLVTNPLTWLTDLRSGMPPQLMGLPIRPSGALPALNTAGDILLVDPQFYVIGQRKGLEIAISEHYRFANDQLAWRVITRVDGQPLVNGTITLEDAATTVSPFVALAAG